jgi:hypothetical protein
MHTVQKRISSTNRGVICASTGIKRLPMGTEILPNLLTLFVHKEFLLLGGVGEFFSPSVERSSTMGVGDVLLVGGQAWRWSCSRDALRATAS